MVKNKNLLKNYNILPVTQKSVFTWRHESLFCVQSNETAAMLMSQTRPVGVELFYVLTLVTAVISHTRPTTIFSHFKN